MNRISYMNSFLGRIIVLRFACPLLAFSLLWTTGVDANLQDIHYSQREGFFFPAMAPYRINGDTPEEFRDFFFFRLDYREGKRELTVEPNGDAYIEGILKLNDETTYKFRSAKLIRESKGFMQLSFETEEIGGQHYKFDGGFLHPAKFKNGGYTELVGVLIKFKEKRFVAQADLEFYVWTFE
jgi:hypothetical protein